MCTRDLHLHATVCMQACIHAHTCMQARKYFCTYGLVWQKNADSDFRISVVASCMPSPDPLADANSRSSLGFRNLHHRASKSRIGGLYFILLFYAILYYSYYSMSHYIISYYVTLYYTRLDYIILYYTMIYYTLLY